MDDFVNGRSTMLADPAVLPPFVETYTDEELPFAEIGAVRSYGTLLPKEPWGGLMKDHTSWSAK